MPEARVNGVRIWYQETGAGEPMTPGSSWISVSSSLLEGYDEPEIFRSSSRQSCLTGVEAGQANNAQAMRAILLASATTSPSIRPSCDCGYPPQNNAFVPPGCMTKPKLAAMFGRIEAKADVTLLRGIAFSGYMYFFTSGSIEIWGDQLYPGRQTTLVRHWASSSRRARRGRYERLQARQAV